MLKIVIIIYLYSFVVVAQEGVCRRRERVTEVVYYQHGFAVSGVPRTRWVTKEVCCAGYTKISEKCVPICDQKCIRGTCIAPNRCDCPPGWTGDTCDTICKEGYWGQNCNNECDCNQSKCNNVNGTCICQSGYIGSKCDIPVREDLCNDKYKGDKCEICKCQPGGECNPRTGKCECYPGYHGDKCDSPCPKNKYGRNCDKDCICEECRSTDGYCKCQDGWIGTTCSDYCPFELFDKVTKECVDDPEIRITWSMIMYSSITVAIIFVVIVIIIAYRNCTKPKYDGMVNWNAHKITIPLPRKSAWNAHYNEEHVYETIPESSVVDEKLFRTLKERIYHDPTYFNGYEVPNTTF